ncbi:MAG TPA: heavy metal-responsive transcriptional regulator [Gammaproteobacteria bacterium]
MPEYRIGEVARTLDVSVHTLRYYEKLGLLSAVARNAAGVRVYSAKEVSRLRFIRRAQKMSFSLAEIGQLLELRANPRCARDEVRTLAAGKLGEIERSLAELKTLRDELTLLINLCRAAADGCPILEGIEEPDR